MHSACTELPFETTLHIRDRCLCLQLQRAARVVSRCFDDALRPLNLTNGQFSLPISLNRPQPARIGSVAALLGMDRTTLTAMLKPLERRGLVEVMIDPKDRRGRVLTLTQPGKSLWAAATPIWKRSHAQLEHRLNEAWLAAAGIAALVAGSFSAGYFLEGAVPGLEPEATADEELVDEIVAYHAFYAAQPGIVSERSDRTVMAQWLSRHMHRNVRIPDLSPSGFRFETARLFLYEDKPIAQIVYQSPNSVPVALCIVASSEARARPFEALHRQGFNLIVWQRNGSTYVVIGALPQAWLRQLSTEISTDL